MADSSKSGSATAEMLTPAQKLMEKHAADEAHRVTVEEAVDEEDIAHPPPSASGASARSDAPATTEPTLSEKAAGKQKAQDGPPPGAKKTANAPLNVQSEEMFPALGAPKARVPVAAPAWSARPAVSAPTNGINGSHTNAAPSSTSSSRASTPASGRGTPGAAASLTGAGLRGPGLPGVSLPGRHMDHFDMSPLQMVPRGQLKKPVRDVLNDINRKSKAKVTMREAGGNIRFEAQGPTASDVRVALKEVASQVGSKQSVKVPVPASLRPHIIGRQGATVNNIKKVTGANIQLPKQDASAPSAEEEDDSMIDVTLEGDPIAIALARREIERIVGERTSSVNYRLRDIPAEFYPFLARSHGALLKSGQDQQDVQIQIPTYHTWTAHPPPRPSGSGQPVRFEPQGNHSILISGERKAAQDAREAIERQVEQLRRQLTVLPMSIERGRHQFIVGDRGMPHSEFLEETGCAVILPPESADDEIIYIVGPPDMVDKGQSKAWDLARQMAMTVVDVARQHRNAPMGSQAHSWALTQYLKQRQAIANLEREHGASIVLPPSPGSSSSWEIYTKDDKASQAARSDIIDMISSHPPARVSGMNVDPFYFQHLRQQVAPQLRNDLGVYLVIPSEADETPQLIMVYEDACPAAKYQIPRGPPSQADVPRYEEALRKAQQHIADLIARQQEITALDVEAPTKFHEKIRRFVDRQQQDLPQDQVPVQILLSDQRPQEARRRSTNGILMRGPADSLQSLHERVLAFIKQEEKDEVERSYTTSCEFPQEYIKNLIGSHGSNINKLRDEFDCEIQAQDGKVEIKGPQAKADAAKAHILSMAKKLKDERVYELTVPPKYHRDLIGAKGSQVNRLQERYGVRINFPRSNSAGEDDNEGSDNGHRAGRNQAPDKVIVKGPSAGADEAKREIESLLKYIVDTSFTATVSVAQSQIPSLIGAGGREMEKLRFETGAQIEVPGANSVADASGRVDITVKGTKDQVEKAKKLLQQRAKAFDETVTKTIDIDKKHHKALIGSGGATIRDIVVKAGGPDDRREVTRMVRFPPQGSDDNAIRVEGNQAVVDKIIAAIESFVSSRDSQVTETIDVPPSKHRLLIGHNGEKRRGLESQFSVTLDIPRQNTPGAAGHQVKITGQPGDVEKAKERILDLVKDQGGETVSVPLHLHHVIADNGNFFRTLRNEHKVKVDHGRQQPPPRPAAAAPPRSKTGNLPLITDDPSSSELNYSWDIVEPTRLPETSETIPWILQGSPAAVAKAKELIEARMQNAGEGSWTGYLGLPDPRSYGLIVGPGGSKINQLRKQSGAQINVPKPGAKDETVEISGSKESCEKAKDLILELIKSQGQGGRRSSS